MQYVGKVGGYMYNQWTLLNPATLLGAIDIIVVEQDDGSLHCSPFHIRFGKFQIIKPLQKKIDFYVNDIKTDLPMKLGDGGEAFFVFESTVDGMISKSAMTSPVISPLSSPEVSPNLEASAGSDGNDLDANELDNFNLDGHIDPEIEAKITLSDSKSTSPGYSPERGPTPTPSITSKLAFENAKKVTMKLNIPSKIDNNGDLVLDMDGYKPNSQKNIDSSDEILKKIFIEELEKFGSQNHEESQINLWDQIIKMDQDGNIRILKLDELENPEEVLAANEQYAQALAEQQQDLTKSSLDPNDEKTYFKTLRLTSEQLKKMNLKYGENRLLFKLNQGNSQVASNLYLWKASTPIVISDIDGTITKSDALGHVLNFIGKDWTHEGVARLFQDIARNGYNIVYLTARSVGQADSTRTYLKSIVQESNIKLPPGPVILSPDRTMAALKREVILKKPEVFKMSCLNDIKSLYYNHTDSSHDSTDGLADKERTPFYAGFGNRITDAISYRSVHIPSHRIFTINPDGEVHLELLEMSGVKSSYLGIGELVDQYFPPIAQLGNYSSLSDPKLSIFASKTAEERFNDINYWREPMNLDDLTDIEDDAPPPEPKSPSLLSIRSFGSDSGTEKKHEKKERQERPSSISSFTSPLKGFMSFNRTDPNDSFDYGDHDNVDDDDVDELDINADDTKDEDDYTEEEEEDEYDDDYEDDYDEEDDYEDDYENEEDVDYENELDADLDEVDEDDTFGSQKQESKYAPSKNNADLKYQANQNDRWAVENSSRLANSSEPLVSTASEMMKNMRV